MTNNLIQLSPHSSRAFRVAQRNSRVNLNPYYNVDVAGELDLIAWIRAQTSVGPAVRVPPGDDLAVMAWNAADLLLVGVDQVLDGAHFDSRIHSPRDIGRKAMDRNLSDCAAMACLPAAAVVSVALPRGSGVAYGRELYLGLRDAADLFHCPIIGGDTGSWSGPLAVSVTILGKSDGINPVTRAGARPGDWIYVSGALGGSLGGRHMRIRPRIELARTLARAGAISAMIDLSDGLARDLAHLCNESGAGAIVQGADVPIHADVDGMPGDRLSHALGDGEDYELLLTSRADLTPQGLTRIGVITEDRQLLLDTATGRRALATGGWEHTL